MNFYRIWQAERPTERPDASLADGFLCGSLIALEGSPDRKLVASVIDPLDGTADPARNDLRARLREIREGLDQDEGDIFPIFTVEEDGEFDLSAWATGFAEAIGNDLETWTYLLAGQPESGKLVLLLSHAVGTEGDAARLYVSVHAQNERLSAIAAEAWTYISALLTTLYRIKLGLEE